MSSGAVSRGHRAAARWGQQWFFELTPDGPDATIVTEIFDFSRVPEDERVDIDNGSMSPSRPASNNSPAKAIR